MPLRPFVFLIAGFLLTATAPAAPTLRVPAGIDHTTWDILLKEYVDSRGLVDYARWSKAAPDRAALFRYVSEFSRTDGEPAVGDEEIASLINAYNAFTVLWILRNYPTPSIRELDDSWGEARWGVGGRAVSLDEIEHKNLRPLYGWKVHAAIVCAARSCPPLQRHAFTAGNLATMTDRSYRAWLGREDLNEFDPAAGKAKVSAIFKWFAGDFAGEGELAAVLEKYAPPAMTAFLRRRTYSVEYLDYHWGLNDQSANGADYDLGFAKMLLP